MSTDQILVFSILFCVFGLLIWGRWRYDLVAFGALVAALIVGVVPNDLAFSGFGHPATIIIALVLVVSRALSTSGAIELLTRHVVDASRSISAHIGIMATLSAGLSAVMNNVGALALLMPVDLQAAAKAKRSPAISLMPLSFASILGGLVTLIGTPPNIIIASFREKALGESYSMFDFTPVGGACAVAGILFVTLIGWRLIPASATEHNAASELADIEGYIAEVKVSEKSSAIGQRVRDLDPQAEENDVAILGLVRRGKRLPGFARNEEIAKGDILVIDAVPEAIEQFVGAVGLEYAGSEKHGGALGTTLAITEVVVPEEARIVGRSALSLKLLYRKGVTLLGVSRRGKRFTDRVRRLEIQKGDILLLLGPEERLSDVVSWLGCLPLADRGIQVTQRDKAWLAVGLFAAAIALASFGILYLPVALAACTVMMVLLNIIPLRQIYETIEWPVIVLIGSLIPIGAALESTGGTALIADGIVALAQGYPPSVVLALLVIVTMTLSDVLNNTATTVIAAPIAIDMANKLGVNPDCIPDGRGGCGVLRLPDADRAQEQYPDHGSGRVSLWRLLAHGPAARDHCDRGRHPDNPDRLAVVNCRRSDSGISVSWNGRSGPAAAD